MMALMRLHAKDDVEKLWNSLLAELGGYESKEITPFYASQSTQGFVTLSLYAKNADSIMDFLTRQICRIDGLSDSHTVLLVKPAFLPILKSTPASMQRYTVEAKVHPQDYSKLYESLLEKKYGPDLILAYVAYLFGEYDLIMSLLAKDQEQVGEFTRSLERNQRVIETRTIPIRRTVLLARKEDWDRFRVRLLYRPSWLKPDAEALYDFNLSVTEYGSPY
jgi:hypothetical protein